MIETIQLANEIKQKINLLEKMRKEIRERAENKAISGANYDRALAVTILQIKNGKPIEFENELIDNKLPANLIEKIAKGICWKEKLETDKAEALYKSLISNIDSVQSELNGLQSCNRYLERV